MGEDDHDGPVRRVPGDHRTGRGARRQHPHLIRSLPLLFTARTALKRLIEGNCRFVKGEMIHPHQDIDRRIEVAAHQHPFAQVFSCIDSRVAPEIVFDHGPGDLFVIGTGAQTSTNSYRAAPSSARWYTACRSASCWGALADATIRQQTALTVQALKADPRLAPLIGKGRLLIQGAYYSLDTGEVTW